MLDPAGPQARAIASLTWSFLAVCGIVYVLVMAALVWAVARRRRASDELPRTSRRLGIVVASATAVTVVTLVVLTTYSVAAGRGLTSPSGSGAITVEVIGHQWWWEFRYQGATPNEWVHAPNELHVLTAVATGGARLVRISRANTAFSASPDTARK